MMILSSHLASFGGLALALAVTAATSPASDVKCGDTISKNAILTANLPCKVSPALIVKGPATLDLNGHTVSCTNDEYSQGIAINGKGATIKNGIVSGCTYGIQNAGAAKVGSVLIKDIIAIGNDVNSIDLYGNNNKIHNATVTVTATNYSYGITVYGDSNQVKDCYLSRSGIYLDGRNNAAISNIVEDMDNTCLRSDGGGSVIKDNTFRRCGWNGVDVGASNSSIVGNKFYSVAASSIYSSLSFYDTYFTSTRIAGNRIYKSGVDGITLWKVRNADVGSNVIVGSGENGISFVPLTRRCTVRNNTVRKCGMAGLRIRGADGNNFIDNKISFCRRGINAGVGSNRNRIINNRASNNTLFDLSDLSADCGSNVWKGNTGKGNLACTQQEK